MIRRKYLADERNAPGPFYVRSGDDFVRQPDAPAEIDQAIEAVAADRTGNLRYAGTDRRIIARIRDARNAPAGQGVPCDALELEEAAGSAPARALAWLMGAIPASWLRRLRVFAPRVRKDAP